MSSGDYSTFPGPVVGGHTAPRRCEELVPGSFRMRSSGLRDAHDGGGDLVPVERVDRGRRLRHGAGMVSHSIA